MPENYTICILENLSKRLEIVTDYDESPNLVKNEQVTRVIHSKWNL